MKIIMKYILVIVFNFCISGLKCQTVTESELKGCWVLTDIVDTSKVESFGKPSWEDTIEFYEENKYKNRNGEGDFIIENNNIILYKTEFTDADQQMADYLGKSLRESTRMKLTDFEIIGDFLYYKIYAEVEPLVMLVKYKKENCR